MSEPDLIRLLLVDDDSAVSRAYGRALASAGISVDTASDGREGVERARTGGFDVILSDIAMPELTGLEFLKAVRAYDLDVPIVLMTGDPGLDGALRAVEYGAFRYLTKPVSLEELTETVHRAAKLHKIARLKREAIELPGREKSRLGERAALEVRFSSAMTRLWMAFQPIVAWRERRVIGYEAFLRSTEPSMKYPAAILEAADRLGRLSEVGRTVRARVASAAVDAPANVKLFVNVHSHDLNDEELCSPDAPLSKIAGRVVLEITERASLYGVKNLSATVAKLKHLGFQLALDDLGVGYSGLTSFTQLEPEMAKLDMSLIRGVDTDIKRQGIVRSMKKLCDELGMLVVSEGVETAAERITLMALGCDLFQGFLFAKPERGFEGVKW